MYRIIIIDDEKIARCTLETYCERYAPNFDVVSAFPNGERAIEFLKKNDDIDIVFCDVKMPGMSGLEVSKWISENKPEIRVVIVSGFSEFTYAKEAMKYNVFYYLIKVIDIKEFKELVLRLEKDLRKKVSRNDNFLLEKLFCELLCGLYESEEALKNAFDGCCAIPFNNALCKIITIRFENLTSLLEERKYYNEDVFQKILTNVLRTAYNNCFTITFKENENEYRCFLIFDEKEKALFDSILPENILADILSTGLTVSENVNIGILDLYRKNSKDILSDNEVDSIVNSYEMEKDGEIKDAFIQKIIAYIHENYRDGITVNDITKVFKISRVYLSKQFKDVTGKTVGEYITDIRMEKSIELVKMDLTSDEICKEVGYIDTRNFRRLFQRYTGKSIYEFKKDFKDLKGK